MNTHTQIPSQCTACTVQAKTISTLLISPSRHPKCVNFKNDKKNSHIYIKWIKNESVYWNPNRRQKILLFKLKRLISSKKINMVHIVSAYHVIQYTVKHMKSIKLPIDTLSKIINIHICDSYAAACILIQLSCVLYCIMLCNLVRHYKFIHIYTVFYLNCNITALENLGSKMPFPHFMLLTQYHVHIYLWYRLSAIQIYLFYRLKSRD